MGFLDYRDVLALSLGAVTKYLINLRKWLMPVRVQCTVRGEHGRESSCSCGGRGRQLVVVHSQQQRKMLRAASPDPFFSIRAFNQGMLLPTFRRRWI